MTVDTALHSAASGRERYQKVVRDWVIRALPGLAILCLWQIASGRLIRENYISKPTDIAKRLFDLFASGEIWPSLQVTGRELILSYVLGAASGMLLGYVLGRAPKVARIVEPYVMAFYGIPKIALAPLFVIWFGIGIWSKVMLAGTMVFFLVFYNVFAGVRSVDPIWRSCWERTSVNSGGKSTFLRQHRSFSWECEWPFPMPLSV